MPAAYRVFFRHIGLDPDVERTPIEAVVLERMLRGGFLSGGLLADVLLIALIDTGVPVWALDAETLDGPLGMRASREGEPLGTRARGARAAGGPPRRGGRLRRARACCSASPRASRAAARTTGLTLFAVQVAGVPTLYAEEALWMRAQRARAALRPRRAPRRRC